MKSGAACGAPGSLYPTASSCSAAQLIDRMHHAQLTETIRRRVAEIFAHLGAEDAAEVRESILIRDGAYCGRRFDVAQGHAIWFVEEDQLKFYRHDGSVARVIEPAASAPLATRIAA